ncbi:MAG: hypothetical protein LC779_04610 [Actinobacteria bacterium]|nr:hypothetical protein [Actinomycetota bacterium]
MVTADKVRKTVYQLLAFQAAAFLSNVLGEPFRSAGTVLTAGSLGLLIRLAHDLRGNTVTHEEVPLRERQPASPSVAWRG